MYIVRSKRETFMPLFTERNNLRKEIEKTYDINPDMYDLILDLCREYFINLAWKYPLCCQDDEVSIYNYSKTKLVRSLKFEIPNLIDEDRNDFVRPEISQDWKTKEWYRNYDQYAVIDLAEYVYKNVQDYENVKEHSYYGHTHIRFYKNRQYHYCKGNFRYALNALFKKGGLLYAMDQNGEIERIVSNKETLKQLKEASSNSDDKSLKELIDSALSFYSKPNPENIQVALEKIWDAFERIKTIYPNLGKKDSSNKLIDAISMGEDNYKNLLFNEFVELNYIGNNFRIRHHETNKIEIVDNRHKEYLFNRCASLLLQCLQYIKN